MTVEELQELYPCMKVFSFMFYGQPGIRDMEILEMGIRTSIQNMPEIIPNQIAGLPQATDIPLHILAEEINEEAARAYDVNRGWLIRFVFPMTFIEGVNGGLDIKDDWWKEFLSDGLKELRIEHKFLFVEELIGRRASDVQ